MGLRKVLIDSARSFGAMALIGGAIAVAAEPFRAILLRLGTTALEELHASQVERRRAKERTDASEVEGIEQPSSSASTETAPSPARAEDASPRSSTARRVCDCPSCIARREMFRRYAS